MDRLERYIGPRRPSQNKSPAPASAPALIPSVSYAADPPRKSRLGLRRQALDLCIVAGALFAAIIVLNESANRRWSLAVGPTYRKGQRYVAAAAAWTNRKFQSAKDATVPVLRERVGLPEPEIALALEDVEDSLSLEDQPINLAENTPNVPTVGTLRLQTVGQTKLHSRPIDSLPNDPAPNDSELESVKKHSEVEEFEIQLRLE